MRGLCCLLWLGESLMCDSKGNGTKISKRAYTWLVSLCHTHREDIPAPATNLRAEMESNILHTSYWVTVSLTPVLTVFIRLQCFLCESNLFGTICRQSPCGSESLPGCFPQTRFSMQINYSTIISAKLILRTLSANESPPNILLLHTLISLLSFTGSNQHLPSSESTKAAISISQI